MECHYSLQKGDRYEDILNKVELYGDKFIFPYSNAHIRDLQVKPQTDKAYYNMDVEILTSICRDHLLNLDGNKILPLFCLPENYLKELGSTIQIVQNAELLSPSLYVELKNKLRVPFQMIFTNQYKELNHKRLLI